MLIDIAKFSESIKELLLNAQKAILNAKVPLGRIKFQTLLIEKNFVQFKIEDNGPGFPDKLLIFEPFTTTDPQSTGIGLATVKELIEHHKGTIKAGKSELGGALIEFIIPVK